MIYYFDVNEEYITCTNAKKTIVADALNYHIAHFNFVDTHWNEYGKTPVFRNIKTGVNKNGSPLDENNECYIPREVITIDGINNYLDIGMRFNYEDTEEVLHEVYTRMDNILLILESSYDNYTQPSEPSQTVYDEIMQEFANRYVDAIYIPDKEILTTDWVEESGTVNITPLFEPTIITSTSTTMRLGTFSDYLDTESYQYTDFYLYYSVDGISEPIEQVATGQTVANPSQRKIQFQVGLNVYEIRITASQITIKRSSGTADYYIHYLGLSFGDYYYYDYQVDGLTEYYRSNIFVTDESREEISGISFNRFPEFTGDTIRIILSQKPNITIHTKFFGFKTNKPIGCTEICNTYGNAVFYNANPDYIDDNTTLYDGFLVTVGQVKEYINRTLTNYGLIP